MVTNENYAVLMELVTHRIAFKIDSRDFKLKAIAAFSNFTHREVEMFCAIMSQHGRLDNGEG